MRAVMLETPQDLLDQRRQRGLDLRDEMWDGVLHMVPPPSFEHQRVGSRLLEILAPRARALGLHALYETGIFDTRAPDRNYRVPDLVFARPESCGQRGILGPAELVIEILSEDDESRDKFDFYAASGVKEIWLIEPATRVVELYVLRGGTYHAVLAADDESLRSAALHVRVSTLPGPKLAIAWDGGQADI